MSLPNNATNGRFGMKSNCEFYESQANQAYESSARAANRTVNGAMSSVMSENGANLGGNNVAQAMRNVFLGPDAVLQPYRALGNIFRTKRNAN